MRAHRSQLAPVFTSPSTGELKRFGGPRRNVRSGLTLLEVVLSLTIMLLAIAAINRLVDIGGERGNDARLYTRGTRLAQSKMAEVEAGVVSVTGESEGRFEGEDSGWSFTVLPEAAGPPNLYTVTVRATRETRGRTVEVTLTQMIFDPAMMGSAAQAERPAAEDPAATDPAAAGTTGTGGTTP